MGGYGSGRRKEAPEYSPIKVASSTKLFTRYLNKNLREGKISSESNPIRQFVRERQESFKEKLQVYRDLHDLKASGAPEDLINDFKQSHGIIEKEDQKSGGMDFETRVSALTKVLESTEDPSIKTGAMLALAGGGEAGGGNMMMMFPYIMKMTMDQSKQEGSIEKEEVKEYFKFLREKATKSDLEVFDKTMNMMKNYKEVFGSKEDSVESWFKQIDRAKEMGFVQEIKNDSFEEKKLDLEFKKFELQEKRLTSEKEGELDLKKEQFAGAREGIGIGMKFLRSFYESDKGKKKEEMTYEDGSRPQMSPPFKCSNPDCRSHADDKKIQIVMEKGKEFECPYGCKFSYVVDENMQICNSEKSQKDLDAKKAEQDKK